MNTNILSTPIDDKNMWLPPHIVKLLKKENINTFGDIVNMTYQEINSIYGIGKQITFKICLRLQWFSPEAFLDTRLANSIEEIDERRYSKYNIIHTAVETYKQYKQKITLKDLEL